jgi:sterol desaturase/sphingolipid hydroxylase (fatty acid hydroxylase superfamily)
MAFDPTVAAVPAYAATILAERAILRRRATANGPSAADYDTRDMVTSLAMGAASLVAPLVMPRLLRPLTPGVGRHGRTLVFGAAALAGATVVADRLGRLDAPDGDAPDGDAPDGRPPAQPRDQLGQPYALPLPQQRGGRESRRRHRRVLRRRAVAKASRKVASVTGVGAVAAGGVAAASAWSWFTAPDKIFARRVLPDLGTGPAAFAAAMVGWDFIYYWNHRLMHQSRAMWAIHVVHHSSERYNLSTALRQPVADAFGVFVPYGLLGLVGIRPSMIAAARAWNLLYQYWVHTDVIGRIGHAEHVLNSPSLHRVHHGSNERYLDRNHAGILIVWDRLFGTHQLEDPDEPVVYGLTTNIRTFNPAVVATHEHRDMLADVAAATDWRTRLGHVLRAPGWKPAA